ncbi:MAG: serine hydrolase domain-containing protein [Pseudomonadota bacterium]
MLTGHVHRDFLGVADTFLKQLPQEAPGGAALCIYHRGEPVVDIWSGTRDRDGTPWTGDTLSLSFSTTKGIVATLLHILAGYGRLDYDVPVARYWPEFAQNGKAGITVRQVLCHEAGLYRIRGLIDSAEEMRDWPHMLSRMEQAEPAHVPGRNNGYHGLTFGWLVGGLVEKISGKPLAQVLREELAAPLALDGCFIGVPDSELPRCADLIVPQRRQGDRPPATTPKKPRSPGMRQQVIEGALRLGGFDPASSVDALMPRGIGRFDWNAPATRQACIPGAGGMFTARSLAKVYAMLANEGEFAGVRLLPRRTVGQLSTVQSRRRGAVIPLPMHWRLGYHRVFTTGPRTPQAFGHFGYGGSGGWCDPSRALAVGYTVNYGIGTPFGDLRLWRINTSAIRAVDSVPTLVRQWLQV